MIINSNYKHLITVSSIVALSNIIANALAVWVIWKQVSAIPVWGAKSIAAYLLISSFLTGFFICWFTTLATKGALLAKKVLPLHWHLKNQTLIDQLPSNVFHRSIVLGIFGTVMAAITLVLFNQLKTEAMLFQEYLVFILIYAATVAVAGTAICFYRTLCASGTRAPSIPSYEDIYDDSL